MNGSRLRPKLVSLILASTIAPFGWSQSTSAPLCLPMFTRRSFLAGHSHPATKTRMRSLTRLRGTEKKNDFVCKIYQLRDYFESDEVCEWIADTIADVIQPGTWKVQNPDQRGTVVHNPKVGVMIVYHTPAAHMEIETFLANMKTTIRSADETMRRMPAKPSNVVPAQFTPASVPAAPVAKNDAIGPSGYPIAAPLQQPKHLFHFIVRYEGSGIPSVLELAKMFNGEMPQNVKDDPTTGGLNHLLHFIVRYEGDGIIDENVVEFIKAYVKTQTSQSDNGPAAPPPAPTSVPTCPLAAAVVGVPCAIPGAGFGYYSSSMPPAGPSDVIPLPTSPGAPQNAARRRGENAARR